MSAQAVPEEFFPGSIRHWGENRPIVPAGFARTGKIPKEKSEAIFKLFPRQGLMLTLPPNTCRIRECES